MAPADEELDRLRELVADERARRTRTEKQLAEERAETSRWRRRARKAEAAAKFSLKLPSLQPRQELDPGSPLLGIAFPAVRVGVYGTPDWIGRVVETAPLEELDEAGWAMLDAVLVGGSECPPGLRTWLELPARQPLIAWHPAGRLAKALASTKPEVVVGSGNVPRGGVLELSIPLEPVSASSAKDPGAVSGRIGQRIEATPAAVARVLFAAAGIDLPFSEPSLSAVAITNRPDRVGSVLDSLRTLKYQHLRVELATHGFSPEAQELARAESWFEDRIRVRPLPGEWSLGRCLNEVIEQTSTHLWAKIDDDDFYGPLYLQEAVIELLTTGADLVGKQTHHLYDYAQDKTYLLQPGNEYRDTTYVPGATFVGRRGAWERVPFAHRRARVDSTFVRGMRAVGLSIYSTSRFEFAVGRGTGEHTWHVDETFYEARGRAVGQGFRKQDIFLPPLD